MNLTDLLQNSQGSKQLSMELRVDGTGSSRYQVQGINADSKITANAIVRKCTLCAKMTSLTFFLWHNKLF